MDAKSDCLRPIAKFCMAQYYCDAAEEPQLAQHYAEPSAPGTGTSQFEFRVPQNAQPHQRLMVQSPTGQRVSVQLPAGASPGRRFRVAVPTAPHGVSRPLDVVAKLGATS